MSIAHSAQFSPFDAYARRYDADFTLTPLGGALRDLVWSRLDSLYMSGEHVLELGCGTGEDALHLAERDVRVTATDASAEMIAVARRKAELRGRSDCVQWRALAMDEIGVALRGRSFDGVISNFGAVNCARDWPALIAGVAGILKPNGWLLWVVMGRHVPWEWVWYTARGQFGKAFRRYAPNGIEWRGLIVRYPTPGELAHLLQPHFRVQRIAPLGCILPPSYAAGWLNRSPRTLRVLARLEAALHRVQFLAACADHYVIEAVRA